MELDDYLRIQEEEFLEYGGNVDKRILIAAKDKNCLVNFYTNYNSIVLEFIDLNSYVICRNDGNYELFIRGSFGGYRGRFKKFLVEYYNISKDYQLPSALNVDHLFNKIRAKNYYIRMILLDGRVNQDWGRAYEKGISKRHQGKVIRNYIFLDYATFLKCLGITSFKKSGIENEDDISKMANNRHYELKRLVDLGKNSEIIKKYFEGEINYFVNDKFK